MESDEAHGPCETPASYPVRCDVTAQQLQEIKDIYLDDDADLGRSASDTWPPRDESGNVYPIWFTPSELNNQERLIDSNGNTYDPFTGNIEPVVRDDSPACNFPLHNWRDRYPNIRLCGQYCYPKEDPEADDDYFSNCYNHRKMSPQSAEAHLQTGMYVKTVDHLYDKLTPWQKIVGWGTFESLMGESQYEYAVEYEEETLDFSDSDIVPDGTDEDGTLTLKLGYPTDYGDRALSLYVAAMKTVQMIAVQSQIMEEQPEEGVGMMETKSVESAQLTAPPSEHDPSPQQFKTLETVGEHHLNLPLSRLITDRPKLLEYGGVTTDPEDESDTVSGDDIVLEIDADNTDSVETKDTEGTDPNQFENLQSKSSKIIENTNE